MQGNPFRKLCIHITTRREMLGGSFHVFYHKKRLFPTTILKISENVHRMP